MVLRGELIEQSIPLIKRDEVLVVEGENRTRSHPSERTTAFRASEPLSNEHPLPGYAAAIRRNRFRQDAGHLSLRFALSNLESNQPREEKMDQQGRNDR